MKKMREGTVIRKRLMKKKFSELYAIVEYSQKKIDYWGDNERACYWIKIKNITMDVIDYKINDIFTD